MNKFDFSGWATRNNLRCSDGRTILKDAFKTNDGQTVPLVWNHQHNDPLNILGHALLENRDNGVYAYCKFNDTEAGRNAKLLVEHGDVSQLSIYANQLKQVGANVLHGAIREVSLVLAGANPGAYIDSVIQHGEESNYEAIIYTGEDISIYHASDDKPADEKREGEKMEEKNNNANSEKTMADVFNTLNEEQKNVVYAMIGQALEESGDLDDDNNEENKGANNMKHNVFDQEDQDTNVLSHSEMEVIMSDARRFGSMKEAVIAHGIENVDYLFPEVQSLNTPPEFIKRETGWVQSVMNGVHHTPFSRIKSTFADITEDDARAKGYIKGKLKKDEVFSLLKRTTTPTTIYKKQKLDRDDVVDIVDFDVISWLKAEMRMMLDEEIARAILVGDGRLSSSDDKINELNIRPIWTDADLYTIRTQNEVKADMTVDDKAKAFIRSAVKARKNYKGSGSPALYTTEDMLTDCLLLEDKNGRVIYDSEDKLKATLRVSDIIAVPVMEGLKRTGGSGDNSYTGKDIALKGIIVNLDDYNIGADKGGAVNMFDDFDIDYNAMKYLIETRCSGALIKPYSAIVIEEVDMTAAAG